MNKHRTSGSGSGIIRIISGLHKGRKLPVLDMPGLRPTTDRVKETLFNWLMFRIQDKKVLDAFSGAGSLGFEAQSRGASEVVMLELNPKVSAQLKNNAGVLNCTNVTVKQTDTLKFLHDCHESFDIIFLDPPFRTGLLEEAVKLLNDTVAPPGCLVYIEHERENEPELPEKFTLLKSGHAGQVTYSLYEITAKADTDSAADNG